MTPEDIQRLASLYKNLMDAAGDLEIWTVEAKMNRDARASLFRAIDSLANAQSEIFDALYELDHLTAGGLAAAEETA